MARANWDISVHTTGTVDWDADHTTQAITQVNGPISRILVDIGSKVHAGEPLLWVSSPDVVNALATYRKARNRVDLAKRVTERSKGLLDHGAMAAKDYEDTVADYNDAMTDVQNSLQPLKIFGITQQRDRRGGEAGRAASIPNSPCVRPIDGTVVQKLVSPGLVIQAGQTVCFLISDVATVWVQGHIFDHDLPIVRMGDAVDETNPSFPGTFRGKIAYIGSFVDPDTRTTPVRIVTQNPAGLLKKDMFVDAVIHTGIAPQSAGASRLRGAARRQERAAGLRARAGPAGQVRAALGDARAAARHSRDHQRLAGRRAGGHRRQPLPAVRQHVQIRNAHDRDDLLPSRSGSAS